MDFLVNMQVAKAIYQKIDSGSLIALILHVLAVMRSLQHYEIITTYQLAFVQYQKP